MTSRRLVCWSIAIALRLTLAGFGVDVPDGLYWQTYHKSIPVVAIGNAAVRIGSALTPDEFDLSVRSLNNWNDKFEAIVTLKDAFIPAKSFPIWTETLADAFEVTIK